MDNNTNSTENNKEKSPILCTAGCGFFGSEAFNNMCSKCFKSTTASSSSTNNKLANEQTTPPPKNKLSTITAPLVIKPQDDIPKVTATSITSIKRKHRASISSPPPPPSASSVAVENKSAPTSTIASPSNSTASTAAEAATSNTLIEPPSEINSTASSPIASTSDEKPIQTNKGRCFKCRLKVPLAKQAANKCRCGYVFCDNHRYPDRHDCDIDYAKLDREILAKNNPKLHERPRGGRSFQRIDSL